MLLFPDDPLHAAETLEHVNARGSHISREGRREKEDMASYTSSFPAICLVFRRPLHRGLLLFVNVPHHAEHNCL